MYPFIKPRIIRNEALTDVPIIPPTVLKRLKFLDTAAEVPATTMEVMMTMLVKIRLSGDEESSGGICTLSARERRMFPLLVLECLRQGDGVS